LNTIITPNEQVTDQLIETAERSGRDVHVDDVWVSVQEARITLPAQGWKLHVSARPGTLAQTLDRALPVLLDQDCAFKVVRSAEVLRELNSGDRDPAVVGKALTVYAEADAVVELGYRLADALTGLSGPRVASDRRVRRDAPVYYRYGPFQPQYRVDENGEFELVVIGPDGQALPGAAGLEFSCPPWAADPFRPATPPSASGQDGSAGPAKTLGGRYNLTAGVIRGPRGNVYRGTDADGQPVVIKEARAYVGENDQGTDLRLHLRNERRILQALSGAPGVPKLIDHFRHGEDEYLVTTDAGTSNLHRFVGERGLFRDDPADTGRDLAVLAGQLLKVLDSVHARGVVVRDLSPKNVVLDDGRCTLIDFGTSAYDGFQVHGWTRGYSVPDQYTNRPAEPTDDYFSLGATLYFAATGMNPIAMGSDLARDFERALMCLDRLYPAAGGVCGLLSRLLSLDAAQRWAAAADLRAGQLESRGLAPAGSRPPGPRLSPGLLEEVVEHTAGQCIAFARQMMDGPADTRRSAPPLTNVQSGSAGLGLELLHHPAAEGVAIELARWTVEVAAPARLPASLYFGRTGTAIFLATVRRMGAAELTQPSPVELDDGERGDYIHGVAGIGAGHLIVQGMEPAEGNLAIAAECARRLLSGQATMPADAVAPAQPGSGVALETGFAHGRAGVASFLLAYHQASGDPAAGVAARERFTELAAQAADLVDVLRGLDARPMGASWCQGMAGIVSALVQAAQAYDGQYLDVAREGARACHALAPQAWVVSQCCGLAGIGEALVDVALATADEEFWQAAAEVAELILIRSGGDFAHPEFPGNSLDSATAGWGVGTPGVLSFLRRLQQRSGARLWTAQWSPPR
jgi:hypothetical protein